MKRRSNKRAAAASPGGPSEPPSPFRFRGLWRDEKLLVVDLADHHFPRRCLKSNQLVDALGKITLTYYGATFAEVQMLQGQRYPNVNIMVVKRSKQRDQVLIELPLPLSSLWRTIWLTPWGIRFILIGIAVVVGGIFGSQFNEDLGYFSLGVGMLMLLAGAAFQIALRFVLPVHRVCEGKLWLGGVHRDWLQRLGKFTPSRTMLAEEIWLLNASLWVCFWVGVLLLGLFLWGHLMGELPKKDNRPWGYALLTGAAVAILIGNRARMLLYTAKQQLAALEVPVPPNRRKRPR